MTSLEYTYGLEAADKPYGCSCPCAATHGSGICEQRMPAGRTVVVMRQQPSGKRMTTRCVPCARESGVLTKVPTTHAKEE
jgi:hypothetical protein